MWISYPSTGAPARASSPRGPAKTVPVIRVRTFSPAKTVSPGSSPSPRTEAPGSPSTPSGSRRVRPSIW